MSKMNLLLRRDAQVMSRFKTRDVAFGYRMGAGFPGDVNRKHPASIEPCLVYATQPPKLFGGAVLASGSNNAVRQPQAGDTSVTTIYGVLVRPYPYQPDAASAYGAVDIGAAVPPVTGECDVLRGGYIMTKCVGTPNKGSPCYLWVAADSGSHKQGYFETSASAGNTVLLTNAQFNGPPDANGNVEIFVWPALVT